MKALAHIRDLLMAIRIFHETADTPFLSGWWAGISIGFVTGLATAVLFGLLR